jgi:hypothetical protein
MFRYRWGRWELNYGTFSKFWYKLGDISKIVLREILVRVDAGIIIATINGNVSRDNNRFS